MPDDFKLKEMKIKKDFTLRTVMGQNIVLAEGNNSDNFGKLITLNSSAAMLWNELQGKEFDIDTVAELLMEKYGFDRTQANADACYILNRMTEKGLLED